MIPELPCLMGMMTTKTTEAFEVVDVQTGAKQTPERFEKQAMPAIYVSDKFRKWRGPYETARLTGRAVNLPRIGPAWLAEANESAQRS